MENGEWGAEIGNGILLLSQIPHSPLHFFYWAAPTGAMEMSIIGVLTLSVLTSEALPDARDIE
jgi:hypothetical protein